RLKFLKLSAATVIGLGAAPSADLQANAAEPGGREQSQAMGGPRVFNGPYVGDNLNQLAFPLGGIGAGMLCLEGTGALSHVSLRNRPEIFHEPCVFAAISLKGVQGGARVLEAPVPTRKIFGPPAPGNAAGATSDGFQVFA